MTSQSKFTVSCQQCGLNELCLPNSLTIDEMDEVDRVVKRGKPLQRGEFLYSTGEDFSSIYAVRSGSIKVFTIDDEGEEQVIGFYLPGELLGMDAIDSRLHMSTAKSMETSSVCEIPFDSIEDLSTSIRNLQMHMYKLLSREIRIDQELQMLLAKKTAEERIGAFLMNLSMRYEQRRLSSTRFRLPMARSDIGNYLGLAVETVSRIFTRMQTMGVLRVEGKEVEILDRQSLCNIAHVRDEEI
ncbi:MAG: fumarate/nitrate reduction transcriptional regulator Fnr [Gammaproteobacteria bacterium]|jgi:CRP/FNR family transcriptional regulator, anaerobic regulatory protein|nr:fumarate/nitrate reduction transcriptional regulator Fnr [Gammaproteobacteria bacterium]MBT4493182.1 fumarate/nitrate reduction transcriptional regulator Fnr [Gammaproteobacteria bacterium]MBT7372292.1 fumarate/nitrate reduction transcriptional regulator Fnr [Gammaproteobacteria bacterium]